MLSDANKKFLYDVGVYDSGDDDDENVITLFFYVYSHVESSKSCRKIYANTWVRFNFMTSLIHKECCVMRVVPFVFTHFESAKNGVHVESQEMGSL